MAYTPYNQALPDTSRYNIDPVLLERLYQPARQDPYQAGMLSAQNTDYSADPFGYTNNKFGVGASLDELLKKEGGGAEGLFSSNTTPIPTKDTSGGGYEGDGGPVDGSNQAGTGRGGGMSPNVGGALGAVLGGMLGFGPMLGYYGGKALATNANNTAANAMPVDPGIQAVVNARAQAQAAAQAEAQAQATAQAQAQGFMESQGFGSDSGFTGSQAGGGGFGPSAPGGM